MKFKIDTKEKMHVITIEEPELAANMTGELRKTLLPFRTASVKNLVVSLEKVIKVETEEEVNTIDDVDRETKLKVLELINTKLTLILIEKLSNVL